MTSTPSYAILDTSGNLVGGKNEDARQDPASTTKVWTLVTLDQLVKDGAISNAFFTKHQKDITLMMRDSNNEAAHRLAAAAGKELGGGESNFIDRMNTLAGQKGLSATHFVTPDGMPAEGHYSTARDMARMMYIYRTEHENILHCSENITTASGIIGCEGIDNFKTGTAHGLYGSNGKSSGVGIKDGYSFSVAGVESSAARRDLVLSIAKNIPTHAAWRQRQRSNGSVISASEEGESGHSQTQDEQPEPRLDDLIQADIPGIFALLFVALMQLMRPSEPSSQGQSVPRGETVVAANTPPVADNNRPFNLPAV